MSYGFFVENLPDEIVGIIRAYYDPETGYYRDRIHEIIEKYSIIPIGFDVINIVSGCKTFREDQIMNIIRCYKEEIPNVFEPLKRYNLGSYRGKHVIEQYRRHVDKYNYISNGEFMIAMIMSGYEFKVGGEFNPSCYFRCRIKPILRKTIRF